MDPNRSFGSWLKYRRRVLGLTQAELARRVGYVAVTIRKIEADELRPSVQAVEKLAEALVIAPAERTAFMRFARDEAYEQDRPLPAALTAQLPQPTPLDHPNLLPTPLTPFVGREHEMAAGSALLLRSEVRLLTLTGPGGVGKTRLALQIARDMLSNPEERPTFADGVYFVPLASINNPGLVVSTIAHALGVGETGRRPLVEQLADSLRNQQMLLVLDNFEQVVAAAPAVAELLAAAPQLKVLITSRMVLHLTGEHEFPVPPLALPDPLALPSLEQLIQSPAVALFMTQAQAVQPNFELTEAHAPIVAAICRRLDGLPLAIELAAARIKLLAPPALLARLERRLPLLTTGARDLPTRQQTLRRTIDWSYDLLDQRERRLFARMAVFVGGCTLEAAEAVCSGTDDPGMAVLDGLASLVDKSLVRQTAQADSERHLEMLETIREYALERLEESGEAETLRHQHALYYLALAETAQAATAGQMNERWWQHIDEEHANFQAALLWSRTANTGEIGLRLAVALGNFWARCGRLREGRAWLMSALRGYQADESSAASTRAYRALQAKAFKQLGVITHWQGDLEAAQPWFEESLRLFQELEDRPRIIDEVNALGMLHHERGDYGRATALFEESLALAHALGDAILINWCRFFQGTLAYTQGDAERAGALWEESLRGFRAEQQPWAIATVLATLAMVTLDQGAHDLASVQLAESLTLLRDLGERWQIIHTLEMCARLAAAQSHDEEDGQSDAIRAARLCGAAEALRGALGAPMLLYQRQSYERGVATLRARLDDATCAAARAAGHALTLEQAIAEALGTHA